MSEKTILIVDDTPDNLDILTEIINSEYKVKAAPNLMIALKIANFPTPPDLILLDVLMPGMDGYEVCKKLKQKKKNRLIPVIFITSNQQKNEIENDLQLGAVVLRCFQKPL